jgi:hypothetical protein
MVYTLERFGDRLLSLVAPRVAAIAQECRGTWETGCRRKCHTNPLAYGANWFWICCTGRNCYTPSTPSPRCCFSF